MDHIRDFYYHNDSSHLGEAALNLMILSKRLENWGDHSVYKNEKGEIIPEILTAMIMIHNYKKANKKDDKQWFDL